MKNANPSCFYLVDPWVNRPELAYQRSWYGLNGPNDMESIYDDVCNKFKNDNRVKILRGPSEQVLETLDDDRLDWVYIDGDHHYEAVKKDLEISYRKVKQGGIIAGDDYINANWFTDGIIRAVNEFIGTNKISIVAKLANQFILRKL